MFQELGKLLHCPALRTQLMPTARSLRMLHAHTRRVLQNLDVISKIVIDLQVVQVQPRIKLSGALSVVKLSEGHVGCSGFTVAPGWWSSVEVGG